MLVDFCLVLENSVGHISVEYVDRVTVCEHGDIRVVDLIDVIRYIAVQVNDLVPVPCRVDIGFPVEFTREVDGVQGHLDTAVADLTGIGEGRAGILET